MIYINEVKPIDTNAECPIIPVHDIDNNQEHNMGKIERHNTFIQKAYQRIKNIGTKNFKSESIVTNTGGYIELSKGKNV